MNQALEEARQKTDELIRLAARYGELDQGAIMECALEIKKALERFE